MCHSGSFDTNSFHFFYENALSVDTSVKYWVKRVELGTFFAAKQRNLKKKSPKIKENPSPKSTIFE